jgi:hypothetical protein
MTMDRDKLPIIAIRESLVEAGPAGYMGCF